MDQARVDTTIQYAIAVSRCVHDDWVFQDLGPIHLLKYVYLADLAYAEKHDTEYTGVTWRFYHFGPWSVEVFDRLEAAATGIEVESRRANSSYREDSIRWRIDDYEVARKLCDDLGRRLPREITSSLQHVVKEFGNSTNALLHYVYRTRPMLNAAPNEVLEFRWAKEAVLQELPTPIEEKKATRNVLKRRQELLKEARARFAKRASELLHERRVTRATQPEPRYDAVFDEGTRRLDELAGPSLEGKSGELEFSEEIWKSPQRTRLHDDST